MADLHWILQALLVVAGLWLFAWLSIHVSDINRIVADSREDAAAAQDDCMGDESWQEVKR